MLAFRRNILFRGHRYSKKPLWLTTQQATARMLSSSTSMTAMHLEEGEYLEDAQEIYVCEPVGTSSTQRRERR